MLEHAFNQSTWEAEVGGSRSVWERVRPCLRKKDKKTKQTKIPKG